MPTKPTIFAPRCSALNPPHLPRGKWACSGSNTSCVFVCANNFIPSRPKFSINCVCSRSNQCRWIKSSDPTSYDFSSGWSDMEQLFCLSQQAAPIAHHYEYSATACNQLPPLPSTTNAKWLCKKKTCLLSCPSGWRKNKLVKVTCFCQRESAYTEAQCDYRLFLTKSQSYGAITSQYWLDGVKFKCLPVKLNK